MKFIEASSNRWIIAAATWIVFVIVFVLLFSNSITSWFSTLIFLPFGIILSIGDASNSRTLLLDYFKLIPLTPYVFIPVVYFVLTWLNGYKKKK